MLTGIINVWPLLAAISILALGNGLNGSLVSLAAQQAQFGTGVTGLVMSGYPLGLIAGTFGLRMAFVFAACLVGVIFLLAPLMARQRT